MASVVGIDGIIFLKDDEEGSRFYSKYYSERFNMLKQSETLHWEKEMFKLFKESLKRLKQMSDPDILSFKGHQILVQKQTDFYVFILADENENELVLLDLMNCINEALADLVKNTKSSLNIETLSKEDRFTRFLSIIDACIYEGAIVTLEPNQVISTVNMDISGSTSNDSPAKKEESTSAFSSVFGLAKKSLKKTLKFPG